MSNRMKAWQCIGCGKLEAPQPCIGVCQDRKVELVYAWEHEQALQRIEALETFLKTFVQTIPRSGEWERCYTSFQERARHLLG